MGAYQSITGGISVLRTADKATIPFDADNADYQVYLAWVAEPNSPDPAASEALGEARVRTKAAIDLEAANEIQAWQAGGTSSGLLAFVDAVAIEEARRLDLDGSPTDAEFPSLKGMVDEGLATDLAEASTFVKADFDTADLLVTLGAVRAVRRKAHEDIDAAVSVAACDAVVAAVTWPS